MSVKCYSETYHADADKRFCASYLLQSFYQIIVYCLTSYFCDFANAAFLLSHCGIL